MEPNTAIFTSFVVDRGDCPHVETDPLMYPASGKGIFKTLTALSPALISFFIGVNLYGNTIGQAEPVRSTVYDWHQNQSALYIESNRKRTVLVNFLDGCEDPENTFPDISSCIKIFTNFGILSTTQKLFSDELQRVNERLNSHENQSDVKKNIEYFRSKLLISNINLKSIYISITNEESVFYWLTTNEGYEFRFESFYFYDKNDPEDIESMLHLYFNGVKVKTYFGLLDDLFLKIRSHYQDFNGSTTSAI